MFGFKLKKKHEETCCCCGEKKETVQTEPAAVGKKIENVKVLGTGKCANCHALYSHTCDAVAEMGLPLEVEYVTDMKQIMSYGIMGFPALVVNDKPVSVGRVLKKDEIIKLLH